MPIRTPILDDRSYQQLRDELVRRIPVYAPEWTDHNASDPGITLIELFAYLGENLLYRFNQIPDATKLAFLNLLKIPLRPAVSATGLVAFSTKKTNSTGTLVDQKTAVLAGKIAFEVQAEVHTFPVSALGWARLSTGIPEDPELLDASRARAQALGLDVSDDQLLFYKTTPIPTDPSAPGVEAVDLSTAVDDTLWIAVVADDKDQVDAIRIGMASKIINIGVLPDQTVESKSDVTACPGASATDVTTEIHWQISTTKTSSGELLQPIFRTLNPVGDTTAGLSQCGVIRLELPSSSLDFGNPPLVVGAEGAGSFPPEIEDEKVAERVVFWLRAFRTDGGPLGRLLWVGINVSEAVQERTAAAEFLGTGTGQPDQEYSLVYSPVVAGSVELDVEEVDGFTPWTEVSSFDGSSEDDRHYIIDAEAGRVVFGNGVLGKAPQIGERIRARSYRYGGGRAGNVAAKAISSVSISGVTVSNPAAFRGGADSEPISDALARIPAEFRRHDRAVAASDFQELALQTPGADVGRAEVLPLYHPSFGSSTKAAGVVSVVVWPKEDPKHPNAPMPDRTLLRTVCRYLDERRLVTTECYVIPPSYVPIALSVGLEVKKGYGIEAVRRWVEVVLRQFLAPLPPYGPEGNGWPLGRRVYGPELYAAALQVDGVEYLTGIELATWNSDDEVWVKVDEVTLDADQVPEIAAMSVVQGDPLPAGDVVAPIVDPEKTVVPVPTLVEEC